MPALSFTMPIPDAEPSDAATGQNPPCLWQNACAPPQRRLPEDKLTQPIMERPPQARYRGRFAPSPTGPLHFGSLVAALGSWLDARSHHGQWLVRMEDVDGPRTIAGADSAILHTLERYGLHWDGNVVYQSARDDRYAAALAQLLGAGRVFPCACTRREIADSAMTPSAPGQELVYPGTCRDGLPAGKQARAWRMRVGQACIGFTDRVQGWQMQDLAHELGDFVVRRADGPYAYQLAVVVDDGEQGITHVVRGADLLQSTARQILLQRELGLPSPDWAHLPVAVGINGEKLSKQTLAPALSDGNISATLTAALGFLGHAPGNDMAGATGSELLEWALQAWDMARVPRVLQQASPSSHCVPAGLN
jgi:glutamyl-Q tRNA(Asp) synthetase